MAEFTGYAFFLDTRLQEWFECGFTDGLIVKKFGMIEANATESVAGRGVLCNKGVFDSKITVRVMLWIRDKNEVR